LKRERTEFRTCY